MEMDKAKREEIKFKKLLIWKNVVIISIGFAFLFAALGTSSIQSSVNKDLGVTASWIVYVSLVISCAFVPSYMIRKLKTKWTMPISMLCYTAFVGAQFYPTYYTFVPAALLMGLGAAPMWSAKCSYLTQVGQLYAEMVGEHKDVILSRFFGVFFFFFQMAGMIGNTISSTILSTGNTSISRSEEFLEICGANFCPINAYNLTTQSSTEGVGNTEEHKKIVTMSYIFIGFAFLSIIIISLFVDPLSRFGLKEKESSETGWRIWIATFTHCKKTNQLLLIPLTLWSGIEQGFYGADFTRAYIACGLGVHMVGFVMLTLDAFDAVLSASFSPIVRRIGRVHIFTFGAVMNMILFITMWLWRPNPDETYLFFVMAAVWGITDAIWQTQINALYGALFPNDTEAAFSNYRLWESVGFIIAYVFSSLVCIDTKLYLVSAFLIVGMVCYYTMEMHEKRKAKIQKDSKQSHPQ